MSETVQLGLTKHQRDLLLRGLRFVRSSVMLEQRDPDPQDEEQRAQELQEIAALTDQLKQTQPVDAKANV